MVDLTQTQVDDVRGIRSKDDLGRTTPHAAPAEASTLAVQLRIAYSTQWGQHVTVCGAGPQLGAWDVCRGHRMQCRHSGELLLWETKLHLAPGTEVAYKYVVISEALEIAAEDAQRRTLTLPDNLAATAAVLVVDTWLGASNPARLLASSLFTKAIFPGTESRFLGKAGSPTRVNPQEKSVILRFSVWDWSLQGDTALAVTGSLPQLGNWQPSEPLPLTRTEDSSWEAEVLVPLSAFPVTYKYCFRQRDGDGLEVEVGENRLASLDTAAGGGAGPKAPLQAPALMVRGDGPFRHEHLWRGAALAVPIFSLRSASSVGVGDFGDLILLADFCRAAGFCMIQLLPINDTSVHLSWWDSYPYSSVSVFALHPLYLVLDNLVDHPDEKLQSSMAAARAEYNELPDVDYEGVLGAKLRIARAVFDAHGLAQMETAGYKSFFDSAALWLRPYAVFCFLRDLFGTAQHWLWGVLSRPTSAVIDRLSDPAQDHHPTILFTYWVQWHLHEQLLAASEYAAAHSVGLKGDLPIGVDKASVDTWLDPGLFRMDCSTGAPPDMFDPKGQNWGFPTYNWEAMSRDGYLWWRRRLDSMARYFHAYRIDHILGFFRIWEIPGCCSTGLLGYFRPSHPLQRHELEQAGVWDFDRLCNPYITMSEVVSHFGDAAPEVAARHLQLIGEDRYKLQEDFCSEASIDENLVARPGSPVWLEEELATRRRGLYALLQNVVLLREKGSSNHFYPRFNLMATSSFAALDASWKATILHLHNDYYYGRQNELWRAHALRVLPPLQAATDMLVCGEDLGMIPAPVHPVMQDLGLIGLRIQRMPCEGDSEFGVPALYPYMCVASPSCHDTSTTRAWLEEDSSRLERYCQQALGMEGDAPKTCTSGLMAQVIQQHLESPAMWAIFPLQDILATSDRYNKRPATQEAINDPTVRHHYWRYRSHVPLETLCADSAYLSGLRRLVAGSGRYTPAQAKGV